MEGDKKEIKSILFSSISHYFFLLLKIIESVHNFSLKIGQTTFSSILEFEPSRIFTDPVLLQSQKNVF